MSQTIRTRTRYLSILTVSVGLAFAGLSCGDQTNDKDPEPFEVVDPGENGDTNTETPADDEADMDPATDDIVPGGGEEVIDQPEDDEPDMGSPTDDPVPGGGEEVIEDNGRTCPASRLDFSPLDGECDPVARTGCSSGECNLTLTMADSGPEFRTTCITTLGSAREGDACTVSSECAEGLFCAELVCRPYCRLATGEGCADGQKCKEINDDISEYGVCAGSC